MPSPVPTNTRLYNKVKDEAKNKFERYPSLYASSWIVRRYKSLGGEYKGRKPLSSKELKRSKSRSRKPCKKGKVRDAITKRCRSPKRKSPKRKSPKRKSPKRKSPKRKSPKRKSPKRSSSLTGINKWYAEEWVQVVDYLQNGKKTQCGASNRSTKACRPLVRVDDKTPTTIPELLKIHSKKELISLARKKRNDMSGRVYWKRGKFYPSK
jgi:penicillin-insensitive murein endopeptidase